MMKGCWLLMKLNDNEIAYIIDGIYFRKDSMTFF